MGEPVRLQLSRRKGFSLQALSIATNGLAAVNVARPSMWGNPWRAKEAQSAGYADGQKMAVYAFRCWLAGDPAWKTGDPDVSRDLILCNTPSLHGRNLACWCKPGEPCHADVLLELANPTPSGDR
jgi:hypothetical protein